MNERADATTDSPSVASRRSRRLGFSVAELLGIIALTVVLAGLCIALFMPAVRTARPAARRTQCMNNLKQIGIALHNYADEWGTLPPAYTVDADGNPLHSWRTLILPWLDQSPLYNTINLSKAWNDPANLKAYETPVPAYSCPSTEGPGTHTTYMAVVARGGCFQSDQPREFSEITDEHGETLMIIEVQPEHAVHWMAPVDADEQRILSFGPESKLAHSGGLNAAFVDGRVRFLSAETPAGQRRDLISISAKDE